MTDTTAVEPGPGHNIGLPIDQFKSRVTDLCDGCDRATKSLPVDMQDVLIDKEKKWSLKLPVPVVTDKETADRLEGFLAQVTAEWRAVEAARKEENRPHNEAIAANNTKYEPLTKRLAIIGAVMKAAALKFLKLEQDRLAAETRRKAAEAAEAQRLAIEAGKKAQANPTVENVVVAQEAAQAMTAATEARDTAAAARPVAKSEYSTRARTLREVRKARVVDQDKAYAWYRSRAEVQELLLQLANQDARAKDGPAVVPGIEFYEEDSLS